MSQLPAFGRLPVLIVACACVGIIGCVLPVGDSLWDRRADPQVYWVFACFAVALCMGVLAVVYPPLSRWHGIIAAEAFAIVVLKYRLRFADLFRGTYGEVMIACAVIAGFLVSAFAAYRTWPRRA